MLASPAEAEAVPLVAGGHTEVIGVVIGVLLGLTLITVMVSTVHSGRVLYIEGPIGKIFVAKKYLVTPSVFKLQKWFLHQNGVEFNKKSKSDLTKLWPRVGR